MGRMGGGPPVGGGNWMAAMALDDEDRIDRSEATKVAPAGLRHVAALSPRGDHLGRRRGGVCSRASWPGRRSCATASMTACPGKAMDGDASVINWTAVTFVGVAIASVFLARLQILLISRVGEKFLRDLRVRVFDHLSMSMDFFDREPTGRLVARMT